MGVTSPCNSRNCSNFTNQKSFVAVETEGEDTDVVVDVVTEGGEQDFLKENKSRDEHTNYKRSSKVSASEVSKGHEVKDVKQHKPPKRITRSASMNEQPEDDEAVLRDEDDDKRSLHDKSTGLFTPSNSNSDDANAKTNRETDLSIEQRGVSSSKYEQW